MRFRAKSLTSLLFAFLLALPMISVISKVIYVQSNKNAYESYYGETINQYKTTKIDNILTYQTNGKVLLDTSYYTSTNDGAHGAYARRMKINNVEFLSINFEIETEKVNEFSIYIDSTNALHMTFYGDDYSTGVIDFYASNNLTMYFNIVSQNFNYNFALNNLFYSIEFNNYSYLDNVFEYAVDEVIKENNFGNIDFFSYFTSIFMSDNQVNNRYIGYINYYLNYALMVSLAYLLFLMLMWFINFARRFLDRGMNYDW